MATNQVQSVLIKIITKVGVEESGQGGYSASTTPFLRAKGWLAPSLAKPDPCIRVRTRPFHFR